MREKGNDKICQKVPHGVERSASFLVDISKLNVLMISNQTMEKLCHIRIRHCVRYLPMKVEKLPFEENKRRMTMKMDGWI